MTPPRHGGHGLVVALVAAIVPVAVGAGCAFFLGPVPCRDDASCPFAQRCVDAVCVEDGGGEGEGEGEGEPDIELYDRLGQFEPNGRPIERCLGVLTTESIIRPPGSSTVLGLNAVGELADIRCEVPDMIACEVPASDDVPASCIIEADVAVCNAPAVATEGPRERCARTLGTPALLLSFTRLDALLTAVGRMPDAADIDLVLVDGDDDDDDSVFVRRDGKVIAPGPIGVFDVDQPTGGDQDCLALDEGGFHDATCTDVREVICQDPTGTFDGPDCDDIGGLLLRCPALTFDDGVDFCIEHNGIMAEIVNRVAYQAVTRVVVSPAWVGARRVENDGGFRWLGGLPLLLE